MNIEELKNKILIIKDKSKIRLSGEGEKGLYGGKNGDLYVKIIINEINEKKNDDTKNEDEKFNLLPFGPALIFASTLCIFYLAHHIGGGPLKRFINDGNITFAEVYPAKRLILCHILF